MLTENMPVPTHCRGSLRAFIKGNPAWEAWAKANGIVSREAKNNHLIAFALAHGLASEVMAILNMAAPASVHVTHESELAPAPAPAPAMAADAAAILAPVEQFLSPLVKAELEKALAPLIVAANKPASVVEKIVERNVYQAPLPAGAMPYATPSGKATVGSIFGFRGQMGRNPITLWESHGAAPAIDPFYVVDNLNMSLLATAIERGSNVWLTGPSGTGKSTMPEQFAAFTGRPCTVFSFDKQADVGEFIGGDQVLPDGSTAWRDGSLIAAVKRPGMVIVLDELTGAPAGVQFMLHSLASAARTYTIHATGEKVTCAPGVVFVVADNTKGFGDETGQYAGTHQANAALVNRFERMIEVDYMSKGDEAKALVNHTQCPKPAAEAMAEFVSRARKMPEMENVVLSLRQMVGFVRAVQDGYTPKVAASVTIINRLPAAERAAMETLFTLAWAQEFSNLMSGTPGDVQPAGVQPSGSAASEAFDDDVSAQIARS